MKTKKWRARKQTLTAAVLEEFIPVIRITLWVDYVTMLWKNANDYNMVGKYSWRQFS
jgi:hypothetical protein